MRKFSCRHFDVGHILILVLAIKNDLATILVSKFDPSPNPRRVRMLLRSIDIHSNRTGIILIQKILYRINIRSEEHTSELQSLMRISYAVFCLTKKKQQNNKSKTSTYTHR